MTITNFSSGWESGDDTWDGDNLTKATTYKNCGTYGARAFLAGAGTDMASNLDATGCSNGQSIFARLMVNLPTLPAVGEYVGLYRIRDGNGDSLVEVGIECSSGPVYDIKATVEHGGGPYTSTISPVAGDWHCLQVKMYYSNTGHVYVDFDGTREITQVTDTRDDSFNANYMDVGAINATSAIAVWVDDCEFDPTTEPDCITLPGAVTNVAASSNLSNKVTITWTKATDATGYYLYRSGGLIQTLGDVATADDFGGAAPVITAGAASATDGTHTDKITLSLAGESIANGTTYTYEIIPFNACGLGGSDSDTGYRDAKTLNYQWQYENGGWNNIIGATTDPYDYSVIGGAPKPTITPGTASASDGTLILHVALSLAGESANKGATTNFRCRLTSTDATTKYSTENTGYVGVGALTYQWRRSAGDVDNTFGDIVGGTTEPYSDTGAPADGSGRYYYCVLSATGATNASSTHDRGYRLAPITPIGSPTAWVWGLATSGVSTVMISGDWGLTWAWGLANGNIVIPIGTPTAWIWRLMAF